MFRNGIQTIYIYPIGEGGATKNTQLTLFIIHSDSSKYYISKICTLL